ncbi:energy transducer TonB [uncultured Acinetobacter sp.]|uniref:energy transducer TonB family protein n=1 Tax=uncultured Acinetobacter sp. TaxID=165433 RepID=UPI0025E82256|nr:TonB family protein [uncultured Acinetobacter sp.]
MSHSSTAPLHTPPPMKKKVIAAILAVIVGHVGVLWAVSQMKAPELPQIKKEPLKVKFVKIKEPPPPKELPKPKEPPKPKQVKIVEKELPPPPKKVEKIVEVKKTETKKVVEKTVKAEPAPVVSTTVTTTVTAKTTPKVEPEPAPKAEKVAEPIQSSPKSVSIGGSGVQWSRSPKLSFKSSELTSSCRVVISIKANEKGSVTSASVKNSSCSPELTNKVSTSVRNAKFKPYKENGIAYPISAEQPFDLTPTTR